MKNQTDFTFAFPLNTGATPHGELIISGKCWECEAGSKEGYGFEPYGFEVAKVMYHGKDRINGSEVTGFYEYLLSNTKDGAENFENATIQHVAELFAMEAPYYVTAIVHPVKAA